jgi:hypothetical protein
MLAIAKSQKNRKKYECKMCDYVSFNKFDFEKHVITIKHINKQKSMESCDFSINLDKKSQEKKPSNQKAFKPNQDAPIKLVVDVVMKSSSTMDERTAALTLIFSDKTKLNLNLNQHLITKIYGLIQSLEAKALWGISDRLADANLTTPKKEARHKLH